MNTEERIRKQFGQYLAKARKNAGVTQADVAEACGLENAQLISNIERGICWPRTDILLQMSKTYKISRAELLDALVEYRKKIWAHGLGLTRKSKLK